LRVSKWPKAPSLRKRHVPKCYTKPRSGSLTSDSTNSGKFLGQMRLSKTDFHGVNYIFYLWRCGPKRTMAFSFLWFLDHAKRHITLGMAPLYQLSAHRRDLYLTTLNSHNRKTSILQTGFETTVSAGERPQTHSSYSVATGTGS